MGPLKGGPQYDVVCRIDEIKGSTNFVICRPMSILKCPHNIIRKLGNNIMSCPLCFPLSMGPMSILGIF